MHIFDAIQYSFLPLHAPHVVDRPVEAGEEPDEQVVDDLEDGHQAEPHGQAQQAARVGHEADEGDLLVALDPRHHGVADVDVDEGQVPPAVWQFNKKIAQKLKMVTARARRWNIQTNYQSRCPTL